MTTRFAPSPTGRLHLGHAYAALVAHDLARQAGGRFLLRFEDIDHTRVRPEYYPAIEEDLHWLNLHWDAPPIRQSERREAYRHAHQQLADLGVLYPCFCTRREIRDEIAGMAHAPHGPEGPLYPGTCRTISPSRRANRLAAGEAHCWRLDARAARDRTGPLTFHDRRAGLVVVDPGLLGDVVLARRDIATSYHLAVVVDDADQEITDVSRGEDLLPSTHVQRLLQALLALPEPRYVHHQLITDEDGRRLATRDQARTLRTLRASGWTPEDVRAHLPALQQGDPT